MLYLTTYHISDDFISQLKGDEVIITPNPKLADIARKKWKNQNAITMANFLKQNLDVEVLSKRDLLHQLLTLWNSYCASEGAEKFFKIFQWYTDFRGHTLSRTITSEAIEVAPPEWTIPLKMIDSLWTQLDFVDEHRAYQLITETEHLSGQHFFFWGFSHLSGTQVDMLQALSKFNDVSICLPVKAWENKKVTDWPSWLEIFGANVIHLQEKKRAKESKLVRALVNEEDLEATLSLLELDSLIIPTKDLKWDNIISIPVKDVDFKVSWDHLEPEFLRIGHELDLLWYSGENLVLSGKEWCEELKKLIRESGYSKKSITIANLFWLEFSDWTQLAEEKNGVVNFTTYQVFKENVKGLLPRLWSIKNGEFENKLSVYSLDLIESIPEDSNVLILSYNDERELQTSPTSWSDEMVKILAPISPIRNLSFELELVCAKLDEIYLKSNLTLIQNSRSKERSFFWDDWCENKNVIEKNLNKNDVIKLEEPFFPTSVSSARLDYFSPTSLQTFLDCPFQYKAKYIEKYQSFTSSPYEMAPFEIGRIQHSLIEKLYPNFDEIKIEEILENEFKVKKVEKLDHYKVKNEVSLAVENGIYFLNSLKKNWPGLNFSFEQKLGSGRADVLSNGENIICIFDFKRSSSSIPSVSEVLNFEKIQLWYYVKRLYKKEIPLIFGWINLINLEESLFFVYGIEKPTDFYGDWRLLGDAEVFEAYNLFEEKTQNDILSCKNFLTTPRSESICEYCSFRYICPKGNE